MIVLRFVGVLLLWIFAFSASFLLAYASLLSGWIVYADFAGALGGADGSATAVAFFWAPLGALFSGLLIASFLVRLVLRRRPRQTREATPASNHSSTRPVDDTGLDIGQRLAEHSALLEELRSLARKHTFEPTRAQASGDPDTRHVSGDERRVA